MIQGEVFPSGWTLASLDEIRSSSGPIVYGILQPGPDQAEGVPYIRPSEIKNDCIQLGLLKKTTSLIAERYVRSALSPGDIVLSIVGTIGKVAVVPAELLGANITQSSARIRPNPELQCGAFLAWLLRSPFVRKQIEVFRLGTGVPRLNLSHVRQIRVPVPPLNEQRRVVDKIEALQQRTRRARAALDAIPLLLKKFRQSVLAAAFRGDLTADWRVRNPDVEPASVLLERIRRKRRRRWEEAELAKMQAKGRVPKDDRWKGRYKEPLSVTGQEQLGLPEGWGRACLDELAYEFKYGSSAKTLEQPVGIPVLRMGNIVNGQVSLDKLKYLPADHEEFPELLLQPGDILFNRTNSPELVGKTATYYGKPAEASFASYLIRVRVCEVLPGLVSGYLNSPQGRSWIQSQINQQVGQANVNGTKLRSLQIPVPPAFEQQEILLRINRLLEAAAEALASARQAKTSVGKLEQSILAKAFRGELVPQDPNDEPAAKLLERIRAERAANPPKRRTRKRQPRASKTHTPRQPTPQPTPPRDPNAPLPNARDYTPEDWRQVLLACLGDDRAERDLAIEAAAHWAAENRGLRFQRLPKNGVIVRGLQAALEEAIRRGEVETVGSSSVRKVPPA